MTASSRITPRNTKRQFVFHLANGMPWVDIDMISEPIGAAGGRAVAAGEQVAADDGGDDVLELLAVADVGLHRVEAERDQHADEPRRRRRRS